jgi:hypothetical protein
MLLNYWKIDETQERVSQNKEGGEMKHRDYMTGYKATDKDMKCQGFQYELGKWYKHEGDVKLCSSGFHFCIHPSGPWSYYNDTGTRVFKVEARDAYEEYTPGADLKIVCREIRLTEELKPSGDQAFDYTVFKNLPGWTLAKCKALHQKHIDGRKQK